MDIRTGTQHRRNEELKISPKIEVTESTCVELGIIQKREKKINVKKQQWEREAVKIKKKKENKNNFGK